MMNTGSPISIHVESSEPPYVFHGIFRSESDDNYRIVGTVGDLSGKTVIVPKRRVTHIVVA